MAESIIGIKDITKTYKIGKIDVNALRGVDFCVEQGEFVAVMGPSGSGKSTLMNILGCLDTPTTGSYFLEDTDVSRLNDNQLAEVRNKKIGFVFQVFNLLSRANVFRNVELPLIYSKNKNDRKKKVIKAIDAVGLTPWIKHRPNELSGGQKQRVAIARALINDPSIVLADEPTGNLDSVTGAEIMSIFQKLNKQGKTILLVTHEMEIARHTQKIIYLRDGKIYKSEKVERPFDAEKRLKEMPKLEDEVAAG
jgi:putative ABC transport system ATP-binding protein